MRKKIIIAIILVLCIAAAVVGYLVYMRMSVEKYPLNGTVAQCSVENQIIFQYIPNTYEAIPLHFSSTGSLIPCEFKDSKPTPACKEFVSTFRGCQIVYRTDKEIHSLSAIYKTGAVEAITVLQGKVK